MKKQHNPDPSKLRSCPPPPPPSEINWSDNTEVVQKAILEAIEKLLDGKEISEFAGSFGIVRRVEDCIQDVRNWKEMSDRLAKSYQISDVLWRRIVKAHQELLRPLYVVLKSSDLEDLRGYAEAIAMLLKANEELGI